jgi:hypothetical protein
MTAEQKIIKHPVEDGCFYCATDTELAQAMGGTQLRRTLHMSAPVQACPHVDPADFGVNEETR